MGGREEGAEREGGNGGKEGRDREREEGRKEGLCMFLLSVVCNCKTEHATVGLVFFT